MFAPLIDGGTTQLPVLIIRLTILAAITIWVLSWLKGGTVMLYRNHLLPLVALFLGWSALSLCWSPYVNVSLQWLVSLVMYAMFFVFVVQGVHSISQVRSLVLLVLGVGFVEGWIGLAQYWWAGEVRARGTFFNPNFFATYEAVVLVLISSLFAFVEFHGLNWKEKLFMGSTAVIASLAFLAAQSRGATVALVAAIIVVGVYRFGQSALVALALVIACVVVIPNPLAQRFREAPAQEPLAYTRFDIWKNSLQRVEDRPWGVGLGVYKYSSFRYQFPIDTAIVRYEKRAESAHNEYLQIAVELGVGGLALLLIGVWQWGREATIFLREELSRWERGVVVGLSGGTLVILFHAAVDSVFHEPTLVLLLILCGSLVLTLRRLRLSSPVSWWTMPFPSHPLRTMFSTLCLALMLFLTVQPALAWYSYKEGVNEVGHGHTDRALRWYRYATLVEPGTTAYRDAVALLLVQQYRQSGDAKWLIQAIEEIKICTELNLMDARFPSRLGLLYKMLAEVSKLSEQRDALIQEAAASFEVAISRSPFSAMNYLELGDIRLKEGRFEEARSYAKQAIAHEPNFLPARVMLAEISLQLGDDQVAAAEFSRIQTVRKQYSGQGLNSQERQYLEVDVDRLEQELLSKLIS